MPGRWNSHRGSITVTLNSTDMLVRHSIIDILAKLKRDVFDDHLRDSFDQQLLDENLRIRQVRWEYRVSCFLFV